MHSYSNEGKAVEAKEKARSAAHRLYLQGMKPLIGISPEGQYKGHYQVKSNDSANLTLTVVELANGELRTLWDIPRAG
jgi:hypothetical protein